VMSSGLNLAHAGLRIGDSGLADAPGVEAMLLCDSGGAGVGQNGMASSAQRLCAAERCRRGELGFGAALPCKIRAQGVPRGGLKGKAGDHGRDR
jgi:hypothetical protein